MHMYFGWRFILIVGNLSFFVQYLLMFIISHEIIPEKTTYLLGMYPTGKIGLLTKKTRPPTTIRIVHPLPSCSPSSSPPPKNEGSSYYRFQ